MKRLFCRIWILALLLVACGGSADPIILENSIVDETPTIGPGEFVSYPFVVDVSVMIGPFVTGAFDASLNSEATMEILVLTEPNFELWQNATSYTAVFQSGQSVGGEFEIPINGSGTFYLIFSNRGDTTNERMAGVIASLVYQQAI